MGPTADPPTGATAPASQTPPQTSVVAPLSPDTPHRILKIAPTSFFADYGCHVRIYEECRILQKLGHQVTICAYHTGRDLPGLDIRRAMNTPWQRTVTVGSNLHKVYYDALLTLKVAQVAREVRPTIIHAHLHEGALIGYPISRMMGVPLVFDFQGSLTSEMLDHKFISMDSAFFGPLQRLERLINSMADVIITSSRNAETLLINDFSYPMEKVINLPDSVDTAVFMPRASFDAADLAALRQRLGIPAAKPVVAYLGLLAQYQGTDKLLEAAARLIMRGVSAHFLVMGFPGEDAYRALAQQLGVAEHCTFTGAIPYGDAPRYLALADVAVSPKVSETEGNGKLLNYMAAGLPTVAFNTPVAQEILGNLGVYARTGDGEDLANVLGALLQDADQWAQRGAELRTRAEEQFSWNATGQRLVEIYQHLTAPR